MHKREIKEAFSQLHASEDLVKEVIALKNEKKNDSRAWRMVARAAVCVAAVVAIVVTAVLWPRGEEPGEQMGMPTVGTTAAPTQLPTTLPDVPTAPTQTQGYELVKLSGVLKVYGSDNKAATEEELKKYEMTDTIETYKTALVPMSDNMGFSIPFLFKFPEEYYGDADISFYISADYGYFHWYVDKFDGLHETLSLKNEDCIYWRHSSMREATSRFGSKGNFYANIIIYADDRIVGYGIIDFIFYDLKTEESMLASFVTTGFTTVCFPMVDGEYQNVTEEDVWKEIEAYKQMKAELEEV